MNSSLSPQISKYKITRRGRKLQISDDTRTLIALPKEVPERTWAEILQKEENDLVVFDMREEILERALNICYERYMDSQNSLFTVYCAAEAWLKLIDWHFFRHDPGEDPSAYPPCYIPKRIESWVPDELPDPSPKDSWCRQDLNVFEENTLDETLQRCPSSSSIDYPVIEEIPSKYWFPGKVRWPESETIGDERPNVTASYIKVLGGTCPSICQDLRMDWQMHEWTGIGGVWNSSQESVQSQSEDLAAESELLQRITDYSTEELLKKESTYSALKTTTPVEASLHGAGDSNLARLKKKPEKSKTFSKASVAGRSKALLPPLERDSRSRVSVISDCRLRNLRLDTQYEISSEKVDTPPGEPVKRK